MAKHKGKRHKGKHDTAPAHTTTPRGAPSTAPPREPVAPQASAVARPEAAEHTLRVEGNVIHFPMPAVELPAQTNDGSGARPTPKEDPAPDADVSALREAHGERERHTEPPSEPSVTDTMGEDTARKPDAEGFFEPSKETTATSSERTETQAVPAPSSHTAEPSARPQPPDPPTQERTEEKAAETGKSAKKPDGRKDVMVRDRKESLSTHLSEEARAFFSEQAYQAAYKTVHDTFEDLVPATEEHARELARSRLWMKISGAVVVAIVLASVGFITWHRRYAVPETTLLASRPPQLVPPTEAQLPQTDPTPAAEPQPLPDPTSPSAETPPPPPSSEPLSVPSSPPAPEEPSGASPTVTEPRTTAPAAEPSGAASTAVAPTAPSGAATPPATPPPAQTPQQLLAAARNFRGPMAGRIAAYEAYFAAAPTDFRTMTTFAMSLAEMGRNADAERIAARAVAVRPDNAQGWFILAFTRKALRDTAGAAEARSRCIAFGGQWAAECRAL